MSEKRKTLTLNNVRHGQKRVRELKNDFLGEIIRCLDQRFVEGKEEEVDLIKAMKILDSQDWADVDDVEMHDRDSLLLIHTKFSSMLDDVDVNEISRE